MIIIILMFPVVISMKWYPAQLVRAKPIGLTQTPDSYVPINKSWEGFRSAVRRNKTVGLYFNNAQFHIYGTNRRCGPDVFIHFRRVVFPSELCKPFGACARLDLGNSCRVALLGLCRSVTQMTRTAIVPLYHSNDQCRSISQMTWTKSLPLYNSNDLRYDWAALHLT